MTEFVFLISWMCALYMTGVIWFVQVVHYPLYLFVPAEAFEAYERRHTARTGFVVAPVMVTEMLSAMTLLLYRPSELSFEIAVMSVALVAITWGSTFFIQVPCHSKLERGFCEQTIIRLVRSNWIRTVAWSSRAIVLLPGALGIVSS